MSVEDIDRVLEPVRLKVLLRSGLQTDDVYEIQWVSAKGRPVNRIKSFEHDEVPTHILPRRSTQTPSWLLEHGLWRKAGSGVVYIWSRSVDMFFFRIRNLPEEGSAAKELQNKLRLFNFTCCHPCLVDLFNICQLNVYGPSHWSMQVGVVLLILYLWWNHYIITTLVKYVLGSSLIPVTLFPACYKGVIQYTNTVAKYTYPSQRQGVLYIGLCVDESELGAANSKDLSPNHPKSWFSKGIPPKCLPPP